MKHAYVQAWLASRMRSALEPAPAGITGRPVEVHLVARPGSPPLADRGP